ncbi:MAG: methionine--tRNA ligase [Balneolaceae bacterium]
MSNKDKRILVTSALPYANGPIHLGHLAGAYLPADIFTRFHRLKGDDIIHISGSDEHGVPITLAAEKEGITPQEIVNKFHTRNKKVFEDLGIDFDYYGRTSSPVHHQTSKDFFLNLHKQGIFIKKKEKQLYDSEADMFLPDRYVKGICPVCGYEEAFGDQCEKCGSSLSPNELKEPRSVLTGNIPELKETEHWYLPLEKLQPKIEQWIEGKEHWKPNVLGQCKSWLKDGLRDRAVTRDLKWGVSVPLEEAANKVLYVWFDAPIGYISATKEWAEQQKNPELWKTYWQDENTTLIHFIGKDNIVFHCIMFPLMLMMHGKFVLPENVPANEFLNLEGKKLSTSRGWAVWVEEYLEDFEPDLLRYVLGTTLPETKDSDFSWNDFQNRVNSELADILGNFVFRTLSFTERFFDSKVPDLVNPSSEDQLALKAIEDTKGKIESAYDRYRFREAIAETMNLARKGNKYFTDMEPWKTRKNDLQTCGNTLHVCLQISAALSILFDPILPQKMKSLRDQLQLRRDTKWNQVNRNMMISGDKISPGDILFTKIEDNQVQKEIEKLRQRATETESEQEKEGKNLPPLKNNTDYSHFAALDIRVGEILSAEAVKKSDKLLKLTVDIGLDRRTIVSGIKKFYNPDEIIGKKVCVVANLAPKPIMGIESNGMILMAEDSSEKLHFIAVNAENGSPVL